MGQLSLADKRKVRKPLLWIGMASITMTFAGLTSGYVVSRSSLLPANNWLQFSLPSAFTYSTICIVLSSIFMWWAVRATKKGQSAVLPMLITFLLGVAFVGLQWWGGQQMIDNGLYFSGTNSAVSWVYAIAGLHVLHVISGIIVLLVSTIKTLRGAYTSSDYYGLQMSAAYWHFLDVLWIYLFFFLAFIR